MNSLLSLTSPPSLRGATLSSEAHFYEETMTPSAVRALLDSREVDSKIKGMKWLLAAMTKGGRGEGGATTTRCEQFFASVVKNVGVRSVEVKKMVYMFLVEYADYDRDCREVRSVGENLGIIVTRGGRGGKFWEAELPPPSTSFLSLLVHNIIIRSTDPSS